MSMSLYLWQVGQQMSAPGRAEAAAAPPARNATPTEGTRHVCPRGAQNMTGSVRRSNVIPGMMSAVVEHGGVLYLAGITGDGDDIATQTAHILSKVPTYRRASCSALDNHFGH